ncbi:hypothetical protein KJA15_00420 [Patescibacteria group bacterium]|nr:hypothetical protein [Patescibacteria group bacterium]
MPSNKNTQDIIKRLDVIINFLLTSLTQSEEKRSKMTLASLASQLRQLGFKNQEIARLLGKTNTQVSHLLYDNKRRKKK